MLKCVLGNPGLYQEEQVSISMAGQPVWVSRGDLWPSGALMWSMPGRGPQVRMCMALMALTQATLCLQNAEVTLGATTNREQTKQLVQSREEGRDGVKNVCNGLGDCELLCIRVAGAEHSQLTESNEAWKKVPWQVRSLSKNKALVGVMLYYKG